MAKKYHIDVNGEVVECRAFLRDCPRTDYSTIEAAVSANNFQKAATELENARKNVQEAFKNRDKLSSYTDTDFSGTDKRKTMRKYIDKIEQNYYSSGIEPELFTVSSQLKQDNISYTNAHEKVSIVRLPVPDYDNGTISSVWKLSIEPSKNSYNQEPVEYELDLHNDFQREMTRAEDILRETVIANSNMSTSRESIEEQTNFLTKQVADAYTLIEEEAQGPSQVWTNAEGYGTFANSDPMNIVVNADYEHTGFRGKTFERFINNNKYYDAMMPSIKLRVYDNETGNSKNAWGVRLYEGKWFIETRTNGSFYHHPVKSAEEAYAYVYEYVETYMKTNDENTAEKKANYASDLITDIDIAISNFIKKKKAMKEQEEAERIAKESKDNLYGRKNSGTIGSILRMLN